MNADKLRTLAGIALTEARVSVPESIKEFLDGKFAHQLINVHGVFHNKKELQDFLMEFYKAGYKDGKVGK